MACRISLERGVSALSEFRVHSFEIRPWIELCPFCVAPCPLSLPLKYPLPDQLADLAYAPIPNRRGLAYAQTPLISNQSPNIPNQSLHSKSPEPVHDAVGRVLIVAVVRR